mgnify:CR=1 FL=1
MVVLPFLAVAIRVAIFQIAAEVTGVVPLDHVAGLEIIHAAAVVGVPIIDAIHPTAPSTAIKLVEVIDTLNIDTTASALVLHVKFEFVTSLTEHIKNGVSIIDLKSCRIEDAARCWHNTGPLGFEVHTVIDRCIAADGQCDGSAFLIRFFRLLGVLRRSILIILALVIIIRLLRIVIFLDGWLFASVRGCLFI